MGMENNDVLLLDSECGLCNSIAIFLHPRLDKRGGMIFITNESEEGKKIISNFSIEQQKADTVYLVRNGKAHIRSAAAIRCLLYLKWKYKIFYPLFWLIPNPLRDLVYKLISKYRHRIFSKPDICIIPSLNNAK